MNSSVVLTLHSARPRGFRPRFSAPSGPSPVTCPAGPTGVQPLIARWLSPQPYPRVHRVRPARVPEVIDLVNASAVLEESLILVSASPASYKSYEKYGVAVISVQDLVSILDKV